MTVTPLSMPEVLRIQPDVHGDERGYFLETFQHARYAEAGIEGPFVQDNLSFSRYGVLRGLHYQHPHAQGKLIQVLQGEVFDVAVDIRRGSPTFGRWLGEHLSAKDHAQLWVPPGFAHGFVALTETALFAYKCTAYYSPACERSIRWDDPNIAIDWPMAPTEVSDKDAAGGYLEGMPLEKLPEAPQA